MKFAGLDRICQPGKTYLEEANHSLQAANQSKIDTILEGRKNHNPAGEEALPVRPDGCLVVSRHSDEDCRSLGRGISALVSQREIESPKPHVRSCSAF
jgi:hypothetical protein